MKSFGGDPDDGERAAVHAHRAADDRRIAGEMPPPEIVAEHHDRRIAGRAPFRRRDHASDRGEDAEQREVVAGDRLDRDLLGAAARIERCTQRHAAEEIDERVVVRAVVLQIAKREPVRQLDVVIERRDRHELVRAAHRQRPEQKRVEDGEQARGRADAEGEREDRGEREGRRPPQRADGVGRILLQDREVLPRRGADDVVDRFDPEARDRRQRRLAARLSALRAEHLLHLAPVLGPEIERQQAQQRAEEPLGARQRGTRRAHAVLGRSSFFSSAMSTSDSSRSISATASRRPRVVSR